MGSKISILSPEDLADLKCSTHFSSAELQVLYRRFQRLDRDGSGTLSAEELLAVPEFAMNPLSSHILPILLSGDNADGASLDDLTDHELSFKGFIQFLSVFHPKADVREKLAFAFRVYNVNRDGRIKPIGLFSIMKNMVGSHMTDEQVWQIVEQTVQVADSNKDGSITIDEFFKGFDDYTKDICTKMSISFTATT